MYVISAESAAGGRSGCLGSLLRVSPSAGRLCPRARLTALLPAASAIGQLPTGSECWPVIGCWSLLELVSGARSRVLISNDSRLVRCTPLLTFIIFIRFFINLSNDRVPASVFSSSSIRLLHDLISADSGAVPLSINLAS